MKLEEKDIPIIAEKGFELAKDLLSPDSFYSLAVHQRKGIYDAFEFDEKTGKVILQTSSKTLKVNPDKITEQGVAVCKSKDGDIFFRDGGRMGTAMEIKPEFCGNRDDYIGSVHTHPGGSPIPSTGDLGASTHNNDQVMCIGTKLNSNRIGVNCYIPKTDWMPEEIMMMDIKVQEIMDNMKEEVLNIKMNKEHLAQIPVYDKHKIKLFSGALLDEVRDYYDIREFRREI